MGWASRSWGAIPVLLAAVLSGCVGTGLPLNLQGADGAAPPPFEGLTFSPMRVEPADPWPDPAAEVLVAWQDGAFAVAASGVDGLPPNAVLAAGLLFTRSAPAGAWEMQDIDVDAVPAVRTLAAWDVVSLLRDAGTVRHDGDTVLATSALPDGSQADVVLRHDRGRVTAVTVTVPDEAHGPYRLLPVERFPFPPTQPLRPDG